ncbi:hypothetical protein D3093_22740 (plasmid) [Azospirillum argentinense]|uniref:Uncharacterized protein n=1 Tax=Azospirillum argentinense TaxID=2970906 RepID=A0A4D8PL14_9PROT|nr:hypothetical protein D3093_22740 [Azospirillum argentinense]
MTRPISGDFGPLPNPPPLRGGGDCRRFAEGTLSRKAGEGRGGGKVSQRQGQCKKTGMPVYSGAHMDNF